MTTDDIAHILKLLLGKAVAVTLPGGEQQLVRVISVDCEGFTYNLIGGDDDSSVVHWWPYDEVVGAREA